MKRKLLVSSREYTFGGSRRLPIQIRITKIILVWGGVIIGPLASHLGVLNNDYGEILVADNLSKVRSWYNNLGLCVQTHRYNLMTWIAFDDSFAPL